MPEPPSKDVDGKLSPKGAGSSASTGSAAFLACDSCIEGYGAILGSMIRLHGILHGVCMIVSHPSPELRQRLQHPLP